MVGMFLSLLSDYLSQGLILRRGIGVVELKELIYLITSAYLVLDWSFLFWVLDRKSLA